MYTKIVDAIELAGKVRRGAKFPELDESGRIGTSLMLYEGADKALGDKNYIDDLKVPGMVHGAFVFSEHPRAKVLKIDTRAAERLPGVIKVITARDVPGEKCVGLIYRDWPVFIGEGDETHCVGDILAMVAADDERTARKAANLIKVEYEVLKPVLTPEEAMAPDAPLVHPPKPNKLCQAGISRGNFDDAWKNAAHTVNVKVQTQHVEHAFLEPESCLAIPLTNGAAPARFGNLSKEQQAAALTAVANGKQTHRVFAGTGRVRRPRPDRRRARVAARQGVRRTGQQRRRIRRQGRPRGAAARRADGVADASGPAKRRSPATKAPGSIRNGIRSSSSTGQVATGTAI